MFRHYFVLSFAFSCFAVLPASAAEKNVASFHLESPAFPAAGEIPQLYTCEGKDIAPPLSWSGAPAGTKSFALIVDDPDAPDPSEPKKIWVHWVIFNIPVNVASLPESGSPLPAGTIEGLNDWKKTGYRGPCPPVGRHRYFFKLYALNAAFAPQEIFDKPKLEKAMSEEHLLGEAELIGTYEMGKR